MANREMYPIKTQVKLSNTNPPQIRDMRYYYEYSDPEDDRYWVPERVLFSFTFDTQDNDERSVANQFLIGIINLENPTEVNSFVQLYDKSYYRFWQKLDEPTEDNNIINSRIIVTPINDFGNGLRSTFILPFKDLTWLRTRELQSTLAVLDKNWSLFSETPEDRKDRPKVMYIYLDVPNQDIEEDRTLLSTEKWIFNSLGNYQNANDRTYRWSVSDTFQKLSINGWMENTQDEQTFITDILQTLLPTYRDYMTEKGIKVDDNFRFKVAIENPRDNRDTIIIYVMKGQRWEV